MKTKAHICTLIIIMTIVLVYSCNSLNVNERKINQKIVNGLYSAENFNKFYDKFHTDSSFQITRINFPLKGFKHDGENQILWSKDNIPYLKTKIYDVDTSEFKVSYKKTETEFVERVWIEGSGFWSEYKFKMINKKWYLILAIEHDL